MAKVTLTDIESGYQSAAAVNANNAVIEAGFEDTLSRSGTTPNQMNADLDMNGYDLLNVSATSGELNFRDSGDWATATAYVRNNLVTVTVAQDATNGGATYICLVDHTSGTFSTDLSSAYWRNFAARGAVGPAGASGAGSGDLVAANNLSELTATAATARTNIDALEDVLATRGDMIYEGASGTTVLGVGTSGQVIVSDGTDPTWGAAGGIESGTIMLFRQTAAPTGWTKITTDTDMALRVTNGTITDYTGGTVFSTVFGAAINAGSTTLSTAQIPAHTHSGTTLATSNPGNHTHTYVEYNSVSGTANKGVNYDDRYTRTGTTGGGGSHTHSISGSVANNTGGGGSHTHSLSMDIAYLDVIVASKD